MGKPISYKGISVSNIIEQSSVIAEEPLPTIPRHLQQCIDLYSSVQQDNILIRCFYSTDGKVFLGTVLVELNDSFLVGAPARLVMGTDKVVSAEGVGGGSIIRVFKNSISYLTFAQDKSLYHYYDYLKVEGREQLPDLITDKVVDSLDNFIEEYKLLHNSNLEVIVNTTAQDIKKQDVPGVSKFGFRPLTTSEKIH
jgi:hypothetical protein